MPRTRPVVSVALAVSCLSVPAAVLSRALGAGRKPVLFVHGFMGASSEWDAMVSSFAAEGNDRTQLHAFSYDFDASSRITAERAQAEVDVLRRRTGAHQVDIVAYSVGRLSARWYLKFLGGSANADDLVSIGSPQHGSCLASLCSAVFSLATASPGMETDPDFRTCFTRPGEPAPDVNYVSLTSSCDLAGPGGPIAGADVKAVLPTPPRRRPGPSLWAGGRPSALPG